MPRQITIVSSLLMCLLSPRVGFAESLSATGDAAGSFFDGLVRWGVLLVVGLLLVVLWRMVARSGRSGRQKLFEVLDDEVGGDSSETPCLPTVIERLLLENQRELSAVEGNLRSESADAKTFYVSSCFHGEGKTVSAVGLALALADSNKEVLLIDGNAQNSSLHRLFQTPRSPGLSDLGTVGEDLSGLLRKTAYPNLTLMTHGESRGGQDSVEQQARLFEEYALGEKFDYVIVDGNSVLGSSHVALVAKYYDGVLLVVECERSKREVVQQVKKKISQVGGQVLGVVLNRRKYYIPRFFYGRK